MRESAGFHASPGGAGDPLSVLLVDDDERVRSVVRVFLERERYRVVEATSGDAALDAAAGAGRFDLLVSDVMMGGMTGIDLAWRLSDVRPDLPVLLMSAHPARMLGLPEAAPPGTHFLQKPFGIATFRAEVRAAIGGV